LDVIGPIPAYGIAPGTRRELDHEIPLEIGGEPGSADDVVANLWFETGPIPNPKVHVEAELNHATCSGLISLVTAQTATAHRWPTAVEDAGLTHPGGAAGVPASGLYRMRAAMTRTGTRTIGGHPPARAERDLRARRLRRSDALWRCCADGGVVYEATFSTNQLAK